MWYDPDSSLGSLIEIVIDTWEDDRVEAHGGTPSPFDEAADVFLIGSSEFVKPERAEGVLKWTWDQAKYLMANVPHTRERLEIAIAREFATGVEQKADRCIELAELVLDRRPNEAVLRFLKRLSRCYIAGLFPECVMLCRAVLENAVAEAFSRHNIPVPATDEGASPMRTRLIAALRLNWLSRASHEAAITVWQRGNTAVHNDPEATRDVIGTIRLTLTVLGDLYSAPAPRS